VWKASASNEFVFEVRHSSWGARDVEHPTAKPPGVFRILGLGDSFTYGVGAAFEDTYLAMLENLLDARPGNHPRVEIIKAGIPRFFTEPERLLLQTTNRVDQTWSRRLHAETSAALPWGSTRQRRTGTTS
jgi:hypothetical protein